MSVYYNEIDKNVAAWLRELIKQGHLPDGEVDERSIADVEPGDLTGFTQCHFFAGIGGWPYALRLGGWDGPVWTGSCPCQPFSNAGKRSGEQDERHLWPEFRRLITECKPAIVFGEQVASKAGRVWLAGVRVDLETLGYAVGAADLCAASVGAPHIRQRLFWVADSKSERKGRERGELVTSQENGIREISGQGSRFSIARDCGATGGMADAHGTRSFQGQQTAAPLGQGSSAFAKGDFRGLGDAENNGRREECSDPGRSGEGNSAQGSAERFGPSYWSSGEWLQCLDGKARRVEPGICPLAHGVPARVGRLRGYGNAIVPQVAAEFVSAFIEVINA